MVAEILRCLTCRQRKIKCDRQAPVCGQCRRSHRKCPGPPPKYRFTPNRVTQSHPSANATTIKSWEESPYQQTAGIGKQTYHAQVSTHIAMPVPTTKTTRVATNLAYEIDAVVCARPLYGFANILHSLPQMLESSPALTAAAECCLSTNSVLSLVPYHSKQIDPKLLGRALNALQLALQDPHQRHSKMTLSAIVMLHRVEFLVNMTGRPILLGPSYSNLQTNGISSILRAIGPFNADDDLLFYIFSVHAFPILCQCISRSETCFLAEPKWVSLFSKRQAKSSIERTLFDVNMVFCQLPGLAFEMRRLSFRANQATHVARQASQVSDQMLKINRSIEALLNDRSKVEIRKCQCPWSPSPDVYRLSDLDLLNLCMIHAVGSIIINNMLTIILTGADMADKIQELILQDAICSKRIWMLHEQARNLSHYPTALMLSGPSAATVYEADWIAATLNELQNRSCENQSELWTTKKIWLQCLMASGLLDSIVIK